MGKKRPFLSPNTATQLHDHIAFIVRIFGQKQNLQFFAQPLDLRFRPLQFFLSQLPKIGIMKQFLCGKAVTLRFSIRLIGLHHRDNLLQLPVDGAQFFRITIDSGFFQLRFQVLPAQSQHFQFFQHRVLPSIV